MTRARDLSKLGNANAVNYTGSGGGGGKPGKQGSAGIIMLKFTYVPG